MQKVSMPIATFDRTQGISHCHTPFDLLALVHFEWVQKAIGKWQKKGFESKPSFETGSG